MSQHASRAPLGVGSAPDIESADWLRALSATGPDREDAVERLHALLLRAARFEVAHGRQAGGGGLDNLAAQGANDALVAVMGALHRYSGDTRFATWAAKYAVVATAVRLRRYRWRDRDLPSESDGWARLLEHGGQASPDARSIAVVREAAVELLAPHQRAVLVAVTLNGVPIDVLAERWGTTRAAIYELLREARGQLRARLAEDGRAFGHSPSRRR